MVKSFNNKSIFVFFRLIVSHRLECEKQELILVLDEANSSLDEEQNKTRRANNATAQTRHEMDKLLKEKDDEMRGGQHDDKKGKVQGSEHKREPVVGNEV